MATIEGMKALSAKIAKLEKAIDMQEPLQQACAMVEATAKKNCPVDTGELRNSIDFVVVGDAGYVGTNKEYAPYVEYGTGIFAAGGNGRQTPWVYCDENGNFYTTHGQRPQPFLEPALTENEPMIREIFAQYIREAMK